MAWFPRYEIVAGLLAGKASPAGGSLQGLYDFPSASHSSSGNVRFAGRNDFANDSWEGAYGTTCLTELLAHAKASVESGNLNQWYLLAEIEVENPEGAQYYKQSYVIEAMDTTSCRFKENSVTYQDMEYKCKWFEAIWQFRVSRYQYDTPYSGYTRTDLSGNGQRSTGFGCEITEENISNAAYYAFTGAWEWDRLLLSLGSFVSTDNKDCFGVAMYGVRSAVPTYRQPHPNPSDRKTFGVIGQTLEWLNTLYGGEFVPEEKDDPNDEDPPEDGPGGGGGGGGEGDHVLPDGPVLIPDKPYYGVSSPSWLTCYKMSAVDVNEFGEEMVTPNLWQAIAQFFTDPLNAIVGISLVPVDAPTTRTGVPEIGTARWSRAYNVVSDEFVDLDCGAIEIPPYWDSCFDFNPFTTVTIFLPYIGYKELNVDEIMGGRLGVKYRVDVVTGDLIAFVYRFASDESIYGSVHFQVIAQYNGNCATRIPTGRLSHDGAINASLSLMSTGLGFVVANCMQTDGIADAGNIGMSQAANQVSGAAMSAISNAKAAVERSGALGSTAGYIGSQKPYIIRHIPRQSKPKNYKQICGYPCNKEGPLSNFETGTLAYVEDIQLNNIPALEDERREIMEYLRGGVIL